jgi:hypothetical protein
MTNYSCDKNNHRTTNELIEKTKMPKLWSCFVPKSDEEKRSRIINKRIDDRLKKDEKIYKATYRLLLLGLLDSFQFDFSLTFRFLRRR